MKKQRCYIMVGKQYIGNVLTMTKKFDEKMVFYTRAQAKKVIRYMRASGVKNLKLVNIESE